MCMLPLDELTSIFLLLSPKSITFKSVNKVFLLSEPNCKELCVIILDSVFMVQRVMFSLPIVTTPSVKSERLINDNLQMSTLLTCFAII